MKKLGVALLLALGVQPCPWGDADAQLPVKRTLPSPSLWPGPLAWHDGNLLVAREGRSTIYRVPVAGGPVDSFLVDGDVRALQVRQDTLWVLLTAPFRLQAHDPDSGSDWSGEAPVQGGAEIHDIAVDPDGGFWVSRIDLGSGEIRVDRLNPWTGQVLLTVVPAEPGTTSRLGLAWCGDRFVLLTDTYTFRYDRAFQWIETTLLWDQWRLNPGIGLDFDGTDLWAGASESTLEGPRAYLVQFGLEPVPVRATSWGAIKRLYP